MRLSIIICTFNRHALLNKCLASLSKQKLDDAEIVIVDNNSTDETIDIVEKYSGIIKNIKYVFEPETGLSIARNTGLNNAITEWILYLDDDAIPFPDMVERALYLVETGDFDCVGGIYYGYFEEEKPKWVDENFGTKDKFSEDLSICPFNIPNGGIVLYRKSIVEKVNGFSRDYGMKGDEIGYGEEIELQKRIYELGGVIMFDPHLKIYHLNKSDRLGVSAIILKGYFSGKDLNFRSETHLFHIIFLMVKSVLGAFYKIPLSIFYMIFKPGFYWQNSVLMVLYPIVFNIGRLKSKISGIYQKKDQNK